MLKFFNTNQQSFLKKLDIILSKRKSEQKKQSVNIRKILLDVKNRGDKAVIKYELKYSKIKSKTKRLRFTKDEISIISKSIDKDLKKSIDLAYTRIKKFHSKQKFASFKFIDSFGFRAFMRTYIVIAKNFSENVRDLIIEWVASEAGQEYLKTSELAKWLLEISPKEVAREVTDFISSGDISKLDTPI